MSLGKRRDNWPSHIFLWTRLEPPGNRSANREYRVYVPGNHEFYGHDIDLTAELEAAAPENITVLSDDLLVLDGVRFLGSTLWTDFKLHGEGEAWFARERARRSMNG
jgi:hypothetical protein